MTFAYQARDPHGKIVSGMTDALNQDNAVNTLMTKGLMVLSIEQRKTKGGVKSSRVKIPDHDLVVFTRQLATMVDAGLPLVTGLTALYEQSDPKKQKNLRAVIGELTARVQAGESFAESLAKQPNVFSRLYVSMIRAGETGGLLAEILERLAGFLEASARLRKKVKSAMTYPVVVIFIAMAITVFLIVQVVPVFAGIFADFDAELPKPTQILLGTSDFFRGYWYILIGVFFGSIYGFRTWVKTKSGRESWDRIILKLPIVGPLTHKICMSRFGRTFAQLIRSGVPILEVMEIVSETSGNTVVEKAITNVRKDVEVGDPLAASLGKQPVFPPMMVRMVSAGEATGKIDEMLEKMSDFWDEEIEATLDALTSLIEPLLIVVLGVIVGGIVIALFLPIFKLNEVVA